MSKKHFSLIRSSEVIRKAITDRLNQIGFKQADIIRDAADRGMVISKSMLSRYLKNTVGVQITEEQVVWLCIRLDIPLVVGVGIPTITQNKKNQNEINFTVPEKYNEKRALTVLKKIFPWT